MRTSSDLVKYIRRITYKPGWTIEAEYLSQDQVVVRLSFRAPCAVTGRTDEIQLGSRNVIDVRMIDNERSLMNYILRLIKAAEEHETLEFFKVDGVAPYYPH